MKTFTFRFLSQAGSIGSNIKNAIRGKPSIRSDEMISSDFEALLQVASPIRMQIMNAIISNEPSSIYELADQLKMSQSYVLKETRALEQLGLIEFIKEKDGRRQRLKPVSKYGRVIFDFGFERSAGVA